MYNLFDDEDDVFQGSPRSKFMDIVYAANRDLVQNELERLMERMAVMEMLLQEQHGEEGVETVIHNAIFNRSEEVTNMTKNLYIISVGNVLTRNE